MTSLAQQLQRLAIPQAKPLLGQDKKRVSLLFDPKEAANLDRETLFAIGFSGFEELLTIDPLFEEFEASLFNESSTEWERSVHTQGVNARLDQALERCFIILSPYFMLKSAHKTLEWLIFRYRVHECNKEALLLAFLPYHDTKIFVRLLQCCDLKSPTDSWNWLHSYAKNGLAVPRATLSNHCQAEPGFLSLVTDQVPKFVKVHQANAAKLRPVLGLYTCLMLAAMQPKERITERIVGVAMPKVVEGLRSESVDHVATSYVILAHLSAHVTLKADFVKTIVPVIVKRARPELRTDMVSCLALLFHNQELPALPEKAFTRLCSDARLVETIAILSRRHDVSALLRALLHRLVPGALSQKPPSQPADKKKKKKKKNEEKEEATPDFRSLLVAIMQTVSVSPKLATHLVHMMLEEATSRYIQLTEDGEEQSESFTDNLSAVFAALQSRYQSELDAQVEDFLARHRDDKAVMGALQAMTSLLVLPAKFRQVTPGQSLTLSLHHASASVRELAVRHLATQISEQQTAVSDFVVTSLVERLADDVSGVVHEVLQLGDLLLTVLDSTRLLWALSHILHARLTLKCNKEWRREAHLCVTLLAKLAVKQPTLADSVLTTLRPFAIVMGSVSERLNKHVVEQIQTCISDQSFKNALTVWLEKCGEGADSVEKADALNSLLVKATAQFLHARPAQQADARFFAPLQRYMQTKKGRGVACFLLGVAVELLALSQSRDCVLTSARRLLLLLQGVSEEDESEGGVYTMSLGRAGLSGLACHQAALSVEERKALLKHGEVPHRLLGSWLASVLVKLAETAPNNPDAWLDAADPHTEVTLQALELLVSKACLAETHSQPFWKQVLTAFIQDTVSAAYALRLCCHLFMQTSLSPLLHVASFHLLAHWVKAGQVTDDVLLAEQSPLLPSLVCSLLHPARAVRSAALSSIKAVRNRDKHNPHAPLLKKISLQEDEIELDPAHLIQALGVLFSADEDAILSSDDVSRHVAGRRATLTYIVQVVVEAGCPAAVRENLLTAVSQVPHRLLVDSLLPLAESLLEEVRQGRADESVYNILDLIITRFDPVTAPCVTEDSTRLTVLLTALSTGANQRGEEQPTTVNQAGGASTSLLTNGKTCSTDQPMEAQSNAQAAEANETEGDVVNTGVGTGSQGEATRSQLSALKQMTREFFYALPSLSVQQQLVTCLVDLALTPDLDLLTLGKVMHVLRHVRLQAEHVSHVLQPREEQAESTVKARKRSRRCAEASSFSVQRARVVLEALQGKVKVSDPAVTHHMAALLFAVLSRLLGGRFEEGEYCQQLVLSALHSYCSKWTQETKPAKQECLSVELLVQCVRSSARPQTQQHALLVMAAVAHLFPEYILHHAMSIFTFMGVSLLQQDDAHTFHVITETLNTLVPAIITAHGSETDPTRLDALITDIVQVFVTARHHIPKQRCHLLFSRLMTTVGVARYSHVLLLLIVESAVRARDVPVVLQMAEGDLESKDKSPLDRDLELACQLSERFSTEVQLDACVQVLSLLQTLTLHNHDKRAPVDAEKLASALRPLHVETLTSQQLKLVQFHAARLVAELISRPAVCQPIVAAAETGSERYTDHFRRFVHECLGLLTKVARASGLHSSSPSAKFWRAMMTKVYEILDKVTWLLPAGVLLTVVSALLEHAQWSVRKKALELLSSKLQQLDPNSCTAEEEEALHVVVERLAAMLENSEDPAGVAQSEKELRTQVRQLSLFCLRLVTKMLGARAPTKFVKLLLPVLALLSASQPPAVLGAALLCCGELSLQLRAHAITSLTALVPPLLAVAANTELLAKSETLLVCVLTALQKLLASLALFLSPYLPKILHAVCLVSVLVPGEPLPDSANKNHPAVRLNNVKTLLSHELAPRVLLPVTLDVYTQLLNTHPDAVACMLGVLRGHVEHVASEELTAHNSALLNIFLRILDVRTQHSQTSESAEIEGACIEALLCMVVRLSESSFRPVYYKLYNWACGDDTTTNSISRKITFFRLSTRLSERLRSLFNLFVGHSVKMAAQLLDQHNTATTEVSCAIESGCELLSHILAMLHSCFSHDCESLVTSEIFSALLKPLVNQLENFLGGADGAVYEKRVSERVIPALTQLAVKHDTGAAKTLNYQICLKTRHAKPQVRVAALACLEELARRLGEEFTALLPETIPFLAELMEDEVESVEQQCQQVVSTLEELLGESLQTYF